MSDRQKGKAKGIFLMILGLVGCLLVGWKSSELPDDGYRFPMSGSEFLLAGTFGELRSNHFHSGIDVKTGGETGKQLYAVRDGYVFRIKSSPYGFGKALYLRHADGEFSVYAHMDGFSPEIESYLFQKQYASKQFEQEIYLGENEMPVTRGQLVGYSGNSGSSSGPHLHFEIRDPEERIMNPLKHYRNFVADHQQPEIVSIALEPIHIDSRIDGKFDKLILKPDGNKGNCHIPGIIKVNGKVGLEYDAFDQLDGASNHCGINYAQLFLDGKPIFSFNLDKFSFDDKRYINVHFDYIHNKNGGRKFERAYVEAGNQLPCYTTSQAGLIDLQDDLVHTLRLELADGYRNTTTCTMQIQRGHDQPLPGSLAGSRSSITHRISRNVLQIKVKNAQTAHLQEGIELNHTNGSQEKLKPSYFEAGELVFLYNLNKWRLPQNFRDPVSGTKTALNLVQTLLPDKDNIVENGNLQLFFPYGCVFDSLQLPLRAYSGNSRSFSEVFEVGDTKVPLFKSFIVSIRPDRTGNPHMVVAKKNRSGNWEYLGGEIKEDGSLFAASSDFGSFCVMADSVSPQIKPLNFKEGGTLSQNSIRLQLSDNFSGINSQKIHCSIDGNWELFEFDGKSSTISHKIRNKGGGSHILEVMAYDNANNMAREVFHIQY